MEGFEDPFNRQTYPWGREDRELLDWYRALGGLRRSHPALRRGSIRYLAGKGPLLIFLREWEGERILCACNAGEDPVEQNLELWCAARPLLGRAHVEHTPEGLVLTVPPRSGVALELGADLPWDGDSGE